MPAGTGALWVGESRGPSGLKLPLLVGSDSQRRTKTFPLQEESENVHNKRYSFNTQVPRPAWWGGARRFNPGVDIHTAHKDLEQAPHLRKREDT